MLRSILLTGLAALLLGAGCDSPRPSDQSASAPARAQERLAVAAAQRADFDSAFYFYENARSIYRELTDRNGSRRVTIAIARLHRLRGDEETAFAQLEEALRLARVFGDSAGIRELGLELLASCRVGEHRDLEGKIVNELLRAWNRPGAENQLAALYGELGETELFRREMERAAYYYQQAHDLAMRGGDSLLAARALLRSGIALEGAGRTADGFQAYSRSLRLAEQAAGGSGIRSELLLRVGNAYAKNGQLDIARRFYSQALTSAIASGNKLAEGYLALQIALCTVGTDPAEALTQCRSVADLFAGYGYVRGSAYARLCYGSVLERAARLTDAAAAYMTAIGDLEDSWLFRSRDIYSECEGVFFGTENGAAYDRLLDLLLRTAQYEKALAVAQRKEAWQHRRVYGGLSLGGSRGSAAGVTDLLPHRISERIGAEAQMGRVLESAAADRNVLAAVKEAIARSGAAVKGERNAPLPIAEIQKRVDGGNAVIWFVPTERSLYQFIITRSRISVQLAAVERKQLVSAILTLNAGMRRMQARGDSISRVAPVTDPGVTESLRLLYEAFVRPGEGDVAAAEQLLLVLPPDIGFVPVHALRRNALPGSPFLIQQKVVMYLPGARWLREKTEGGGTGEKKVAGMGYTGGSGWDVEYELRDIRSFYKEAKLLFGEQASLKRLSGERGDLLHLAAEFRQAAGAPWSASVILSGGAAAELWTSIPVGSFAPGVQFPSVVLSNLTPDQPEIPSVVAPLLLAGVPSTVVATAYTPPRKLKKIFGEAFYTALLGGSTPSRSYQSAVRELIRNPEFGSPQVWGTFVCWGR